MHTHIKDNIYNRQNAYNQCIKHEHKTNNDWWSMEEYDVEWSCIRDDADSKMRVR